MTTIILGNPNTPRLKFKPPNNDGNGMGCSFMFFMILIVLVIYGVLQCVSCINQP